MASAESGPPPRRSDPGRGSEDEFVELGYKGLGVLKKIVRRGTGDVPEIGHTVVVRYTGSLPDGTVFDSTAVGGADEGVSYDLGRSGTFPEDMPPGVDVAIASMSVGEQCTVKLTTEAMCFGANGRPGLGIDPGVVDLQYDIELLNAQDRERSLFNLPDDEKLAVARKCRERGNELFKEGKHVLASEEYDRGYAHLDKIFETPDSTMRLNVRELKVTCLVNNAQCCLQLGRYRETITLCTRALEIESESVKAFFRRGQAYLKLSEFKAACRDLVDAAKLDPKNKAIRRALDAAKERAAAEKAKVKRMYTSMFKQGVEGGGSEGGARAGRGGLYDDKPDPVIDESIFEMAWNAVLHPIATAMRIIAFARWCVAWCVGLAKDTVSWAVGLCVWVLSTIPIVGRLLASDAAGPGKRGSGGGGGGGGSSSSGDAGRRAAPADRAKQE